MQSNYLGQKSVQELANKNAMNRRRFSLGNFPSQQAELSSQKYPKPDMFTDQTNLQFGNQSDTSLTRYLLQQQQHQSHNQENISNLLKLCHNQYMDSPPYHTENQSFFPQFCESETFSAPLSSANPPQSSNLVQIQNLQRRRASYCVGSSQLKPVIESRSSSPVFNQSSTYQDQLIQHQQQMLEQKLNLLASSAFMSPPTPAKKFSHSQQNLCQTSTTFRARASSMGAIESAGLLKSPSSAFTPLAIQNNKHLIENFEEKLATTGNIFQRREDWSILKKLPVAKQNSIHIRLEDEGPFGNDETRCFVLSHLSSLCIREMSCVFCSCSLVIYDRFPLVDGTMFVSPSMYDKNKSIPAIVSNKQQYLNSVCLDCIIGTRRHEIKCKYCGKLWQSLGAFSLQIGNLYKYDIFAAFPCCVQRLTCFQCSATVMDLDAAGNESFSCFSEEKECPQCRTRAYHFIKPLKDLFFDFEPVDQDENLIKLDHEPLQESNFNQ
ncbi:headcase isoform X1 [Brachionus plicatilis]|uniref:Headcase isoform X1 n=1 Tax=Brachionus plicatilis TaxID=10195 RepID=A0A3M7QA06_BRAPC|nr:headcase isoform X1 [Brachionus plicatilis]